MIIAAFKHRQTKVFTKSAHQFDRGQKLIITGIALPETFEVHISNEKNGGLAYSCQGHAEGTYIPDALFASGEYVYVWIYATSIGHEGTSHGYDDWDDDESIHEVTVDARTVDEGKTAYEIVIPVIRRPVQLPTVAIESEGSFGYMVDENEVLVPVNN